MKVDKKLKTELLGLLRDMDIPSYRKKLESNYDGIWIRKHLHIKNSEHKNFNRAMDLINQILE